MINKILAEYTDRHTLLILITTCISILSTPLVSAGTSLKSSVELELSNNAKKFNLIVFTTDDNDAEELGSYGSLYPFVTPSLNNFSASGIQFQNAYSTGSTCQTSRLSFISGRHPQNNGNFGHGDPLVNALVDPLPNLMRRNGYYTGVINKFPHYDAFNPLAWDIVSAAELGVPPGNPDVFPIKSSVSGFSEITNAFIDKARSRNKPFFLHINTRDPHRPYPSLEPTEVRTFGDAYAGPTIKTILPFEKKLNFVKPISLPPYLPNLPDIELEMREHLTALNRGDTAFRDVIEMLQKRRLYDDTIVIYFADQGTSVPGSKQSLYRQGIRIPLIIKLDKERNVPGMKIESLVSIIDLYPTIAELFNFEIDNELVDGTSLSRVIKGEIDSINDFVFSSYNYAVRGLQVYPMRSVTDGKYLYIYNIWFNQDNPKTHLKLVYENAEVHTGMTWEAMINSDDSFSRKRVKMLRHRAQEELYDLTSDPNNLINLVESNSFSKVRNNMHAVLLDFLKSVDDPLQNSIRYGEPIPASMFALRSDTDNGIDSEAEFKAVTTALETVRTALEEYYTVNGKYPISENWDGVDSLWGKSTEDWIPGITPHYISKLPRIDEFVLIGEEASILYNSNGEEFKLIILNGELIDFALEYGEKYIDPKRGDSVGVWSKSYGLVDNAEKKFNAVTNALDEIKIALERYYQNNGEYPLSQGWDGIGSKWGKDTVHWIPGLVPQYIDRLPKVSDFTLINRKGVFLYKSDGEEFKLIILNGRMKKYALQYGEHYIDLKRTDSIGFWNEENGSTW